MIGMNVWLGILMGAYSCQDLEHLALLEEVGAVSSPVQHKLLDRRHT